MHMLAYMIFSHVLAEESVCPADIPFRSERKLLKMGIRAILLSAHSPLWCISTATGTSEGNKQLIFRQFACSHPKRHGFSVFSQGSQQAGKHPPPSHYISWVVRNGDTVRYI